MRRFLHKPAHNRSQVASRSSVYTRAFLFHHGKAPQSSFQFGLPSTQWSSIMFHTAVTRSHHILDREPLLPGHCRSAQSRRPHFDPVLSEQSALETEVSSFFKVRGGRWRKRFNGRFRLHSLLLFHPLAPNSSLSATLSPITTVPSLSFAFLGPLEANN